MQTFQEILRELKYLPQEHEVSENYDLPELTDDETKAIIQKARQEKYNAEKSKRYWDRVKKLTTVPKLSADQYLEIVLTRAKKEIKDFQERQDQIEIFKMLSEYFTQDPKFEIRGHSLKKGIVLFGGVGCGKTTIMRLFNQNPLFSFVVLSCRMIASKYAQEGPAVVYRYSGQYDATMVENAFQCTSWGLCFDDLGTESDKKHFGNQLNVMESILLNRYDNHNQLRNRTHITTNLSAEEIEENYGTRVKSRMREMFNIIDVSGEDLRK